MLGIDPHAARVTWTVFLFCLIIGLAWMARDTLLVFFIALLLAYLVSPLVQLLAKLLPQKAPRAVPAGLVFAMAGAVMIAAMVVIGARVVGELAQVEGKYSTFFLEEDRIMGNDLHLVDVPYQKTHP